MKSASYFSRIRTAKKKNTQTDERRTKEDKCKQLACLWKNRRERKRERENNAHALLTGKKLFHSIQVHHRLYSLSSRLCTYASTLTYLITTKNTICVYLSACLSTITFSVDLVDFTTREGPSLSLSTKSLERKYYSC